MKENKFMDIARDIATLVDEKDKAYGSAFEKTTELIKILYPDGVEPSQYGNFLALVRTLDKMVRLATNNGSDPMNEDSWSDIMGYAILAMYNNRKKDEQATRSEYEEE